MPQSPHVVLGARIRTARRAADLTEIEVARDPRLVVDQRTVSRWELGEAQPLGIHRPELVKVLGLRNYHELFIPEEVAPLVGNQERELLCTASTIPRGGNGWWLTVHHGNRGIALGLGLLWLAQPDDTGRHPHHWRLTGSGEDVLEVFRSRDGDS